MRKTMTLAAISLALSGCAGLPPIVFGARFLVVVESGADVAQLDFVDMQGCLAAQRNAPEGATRCQRTTLWNTLLVEADAVMPQGDRIGAHFHTIEQCQKPGALSLVGATVAMPCVRVAPMRARVPETK